VASENDERNEIMLFIHMREYFGINIGCAISPFCGPNICLALFEIFTALSVIIEVF
jgi:hypothetical protein